MTIRFIPEGTVEVPEIQFTDGITLAVPETALLVQDLQNDFVDPEGALAIPAAAQTIPVIQRLLVRARAQGVRVVYVQDTHHESDPEFDIWGAHTEQGTWGWDIVDHLTPGPGDLQIQKNRYDSFYGTWLDHYLSHVWHIRSLVLVGTVSNICVLHTAASAGLRHFHVVVPADAISALTDFDQAMALRQISWLYGGSVVRSADDIHFSQLPDGASEGR
jgi:nicotinamidase-related amidase